MVVGEGGGHGPDPAEMARMWVGREPRRQPEQAAPHRLDRPAAHQPCQHLVAEADASAVTGRELGGEQGQQRCGVQHRASVRRRGYRRQPRRWSVWTTVPRPPPLWTPLTTLDRTHLAARIRTLSVRIRARRCVRSGEGREVEKARGQRSLPSGIRMLSSRLTKVMIRAPRMASQKNESTWKYRFRAPASQEVS